MAKPVAKLMQTYTAWLRNMAQYGAAVARGLILLGIWGLALFGWSTLGEDALRRRLPPVHAAAQSYAEAVGTYLQGLAATLQPLAEDPRLVQGVASDDGITSLEVRRAMYEFGYLNRLNQLYIWEEQSGTVGQLAGSRELPSEVAVWLGKLDEQPVALAVFDISTRPQLYLAMHAADSATHVYVVMPASWQGLLLGQPRAPVLGGFGKAETFMLVSQNGRLWQAPRLSRERPRLMTELDAVAASTVAKAPNGDIIVAAPVPGVAGWGVAYRLPPSVALGASRMAQWGVILAALLASIAVLWKPTRPARRKVAAKLAPLAGVITPLTTPLISSVAAVMKGERQPPAQAQAIIQPGQFKQEELAGGQPQRRGKAMQFGSNPPRPAAKVMTAPSNYMPTEAAAASSSAAGRPKKAPVLTDAMARLVDECLTQGRSQLLYQPIYQVSTGKPAFHEVLLRLIDRDGNPVSPGAFLPVCEQHGWLDRLDSHVLDRVLELNFAGGLHPATPLTLNLAGASMDSLDYLQKLLTLDDAEVIKHLVLEVSSQELLKDPTAIDFLREVHEAGAKLSVDYFGGGPTMLQASQKMGFDMLKMDCARMGGDTAAKREVLMLAQAAKRTDVALVLEKVETVEMEVFARRAGVKFLQGYLLGKPKPDLVSATLPGWSEMARMEKEQVSSEDEAAQEPEAAPEGVADDAATEAGDTNAPPPALPDSSSK
ncbi:MAG: EAL domain-containing protein [Pseudomonadaceae bacterium]|nr:EAL domain-containing protein [Pseudomonadaceae bacterium]